MGQAKQRGNFEERKLFAIEQRRLIEIAKENKRIKQEQELRQWALDNPKQVAIANSKGLLLGAMLAIVLPTTAFTTEANNEHS